MGKSTVIDISKHQGTFNATTAKNQGVELVLCRAAYATTKDTKFSAFAKEVRSAGLELGAYYFCTWHYSSKATTKDVAISVMRQQTNSLITYLRAEDITSYVAIDLEFEAGKSTVLSKAEMTEIANMQCDLLKAAGYTPMVYASISWFFDRMNGTDLKYPLWVAYYNNSITDRNFAVGSYASKLNTLKDKILFVQHSSSGVGRDYGVTSTRIDLNYAYTKTLRVHASTASAATTTTTTPAATSSSSTTKEETYGTDGQKIALKNTNLYVSSTAANATSKKTGTYYIWSNKLVNGRLRITNSSSRVGVRGQITGWIKPSDIGGTVTTTTTTPAATTSNSSYVAGQAISVSNKPLYASATAKTASGKKSGTFYIYDGIKINGRYRVTVKASYCGKTPVGIYTTGWFEL